MAAHHNINPNQLKMFMSAREIQEGYQVLDADREEFSHDRYYEPTNSPLSTAGNPNIQIPSGARVPGIHPDDAPGGWEWALRRHGDDLANYSHLHGDDYHTESDSEVWDRKLSESRMNPIDYAEARGEEPPEPPDFDPDEGGFMGSVKHPMLRSDASAVGSGSEFDRRMESYEGHQDSRYNRAYQSWEQKMSGDGPSLYEHLQTRGVEAPVHLGTGDAPGSQGKPQVFGGHHRIAAMAHMNQDQLMPVIHHEHWGAARMGQGYKYT